MKIPVHLEPTPGSPRASRDVQYRWDPDTEILSAQLTALDSADASEITFESVGVEGSDGSWLILDVASGAISGVEIAVWPEVHTRQALSPPATVEDADVRLAPASVGAMLGSLETQMPLVAESDGDQRTFHFRLGRSNADRGRTVRLGRDLLLDVDEKSHISGLWLLNVPPCPTEP